MSSDCETKLDRWYQRHSNAPAAAARTLVIQAHSILDRARYCALSADCVISNVHEYCAVIWRDVMWQQVTWSMVESLACVTHNSLIALRFHWELYRRRQNSDDLLRFCRQRRRKTYASAGCTTARASPHNYCYTTHAWMNSLPSFFRHFLIFCGISDIKPLWMFFVVVALILWS